MLIPARYIDHAWDVVSPDIQRAIERSAGEYTLADILDALRAGTWQLWTDGGSVACTSVQEFPARRVLYVMMAAGKRDAVPLFWPRIREFGLKEGCKAVQFFGRPGWRRSHVLPDGWRHTHDVVTVELSE